MGERNQETEQQAQMVRRVLGITKDNKKSIVEIQPGRAPLSRPVNRRVATSYFLYLRVLRIPLVAMKNKIYLITAIVLMSNGLLAQPFEKISADISFNNHFGYLVLADMDNDGDPEVIQTGLDGFNIFNNDNGIFQEPVGYAQFKGESQLMVHTLDVGDIDRDGFIDVLQSAGPNNRIFHILINTHPGFDNIAGNYLNGLAGASFLGDFEADGDLDIIYAGADKWSNNLAGILLNRNSNFIPGPWIPQHDTWLDTRFTTWSDLDQDSELEVIQAVAGSYTPWATYILEKNYPAMTVSKELSVTPYISNATFADYDGDGDLDMLTKQNPNTLYKSVNGDFVATGVTFPQSKTAEFGDINNDGLYDVIIGGMMTATWQVFETGVYLNQADGSFAKLDAQIPSFEGCSAAIADIDGDGDLDIPTLNGIYKNNTAVVNAMPSAPVVIGSSVSGPSVTFTWQGATDDTTPTNSLTYNIDVRSADGTIVVPGHSLPSGRRQIYKVGNAYNKLSFQLNCLKQGTYYWKVQALDASYGGSQFSAEQSFTITSVPPVAPAELIATPVSDEGIKLTWTDQSETEDAFIIFRNSGFGFYPIDTIPANQTQYVDTHYLNPETNYTYRIAASNCAYPDEFGSETSATTFPRPFINSNWLTLDKAGSMVLLGDYDNDEDLDMLLRHAGSTDTKLFRFEDNRYVDSGLQLPPAEDAHWLDYNNDGRMDLLLVAESYFFNSYLRLFKNTVDYSFVEVLGNIPHIQNVEWQGGISFGDYDNDGDEDIVLQAGGIIFLDNDGKGQFTKNADINLDGNMKGSGVMADFDRDGDLDILASKEVSCTSNIAIVFENNGNKTFTEVELGELQGTNDDYWNNTGDLQWGDYDNDGYPDILAAGQNTCGNGYGINRIYHNNRNKTFTLAADLVQLIYDVNVDWGDYDNDGDLDVFAFGDPFGAYSLRTRIYENNENSFTETNINYLLQSTQSGKATRGDIDGDGDLDYVILGEINYTSSAIIVYKNTYAESWGLPNHRPTAPGAPRSDVGPDQSVTLSWSAAEDEETAQNGLTYNFYLIDEKDSIVTNSYSLPNGSRKLVSAGNASSQTSITLNNLQPGTYTWAVQSIDKGFAGSLFSEEQTFTISPIAGLEHEAFAGIELYPNPVERYLTVNSKKKAELEISNTYGHRIMNLSVGEAESSEDLSSLPPGVYFVSILRNGVTIGVRKLIKK
jgi:hypothetical protein